MPRIPRMVIDDETTVYHVMSRTALDGFPLPGTTTKGITVAAIFGETGLKVLS